MFVKKYDDSYFLADPKIFIRNHYPVDTQWTLIAPRLAPDEGKEAQASAPSLQEFLNGPLIYSSAYRYTITRIYPETFDLNTAKDETVNFQFSTDQTIEQIDLSIYQGDKKKDYQPEFSKNAEGLYSLDHVFSEKGRHIVHVLLNKSYAFTYTVTVK